MEFDSPEERKNFPGLYSFEKRRGTDDYNHDSEKSIKKEMIIGKRKDKKDKKDKDKGYAALEGESSEDESSPCKAKKSKAFKFSKSKDKGESISSKYKAKKKAKPQKTAKSNKSVCTVHRDLAEELPIFGCSLKDACQRGMCHDKIPIPLPLRECIDFVEEKGIDFENVYKTSGNKHKVQHIKKLYDNRQPVRFYEYDVPTVTSVLKQFIRELPEPLLTYELSAKFEEAAAILTCHTRVKHLRALLKTLPKENEIVLGWVIVHLYNVTEKEQFNKMTIQNVAQALHHSLHMSSKVLHSLISHKEDLFPNVIIVKYDPPLESGGIYPENLNEIAKELEKLESALNLIHWEMQNNYSSKNRQDQLWELQRIQTELKRKQKKAAKQNNTQEDSQNMDQTEESFEGSEAQSSMEAEVERLLTGPKGLPPVQTVPKSRPTDVKRLYGNEGETFIQSESEEVVQEAESETEDDQDGAVGVWYHEELEGSENESEEVQKLDEQEPNEKQSDEELLSQLVESTDNSTTLSQNQCAQPCDPKTGSQDYFEEKVFTISAEFNDTTSVRFRQNKLIKEVIHSGETITNKLDCLNTAQLEKLCENTLTFLDTYSCADVLLVQFKNQLLKDFKNQLIETITEANLDNSKYESLLEGHCWYVYGKIKKSADHLRKVVNLLAKENHMLQVNKIELIRKIMEEREQCVELEATIKVFETLKRQE